MFEEKVEINIYGKHYTLTREMVIDAAKRLKKEGYAVRSRTKYHVIIDGVRFTTPSLFAEALGLMLIEASGQQAFRAMVSLGFTVVDARREKRQKGESSETKAH